MNNVNMIGRLTRDPELRYTPNGVPVTNFAIAINEGFGDQQQTQFVDVVAWRKTAENVANYVKKGDRVGITGKIQSRTYENNEGRNVKVTEVVAFNVEFLETKNQGGNQGNYQSNPGNQNQGGYNDPFGAGQPIDINDDDLPF